VSVPAQASVARGMAGAAACVTLGGCVLILCLCARWDEWVPPGRLLKYNETNIAHQKSLQASAGSGGSASAAKSKTGATSAAGGRGAPRKDGTRGTKRAREEVCCYFSTVLQS
jgi:hypothetical protein